MSKQSAAVAFSVASRSVVVALFAAVVIAGAALIAFGPRPPRARSSSEATAVPALRPAARSGINASYAALPLAFEVNQGQTDPQVKYVARASGYTLFLTSREAVFSLHSASSSRNRMSTISRTVGTHGKNYARTGAAQKDSTAVVRMRLLGGNSRAEISASDKVPGKINYYIGSDSKKWRTGVEQYARVSYRDVYPGVNLAFHGAQRQLEFDFVVAPEADAKPIELGFTGAERLETDASGNLVLSSSAGSVMLHKPVAYQERGGKRLPVDAAFVVRNNEVTFALGAYDRSRELVIDPALSYATYLGGGLVDDAFGIAVDAAGSAYVTGETSSTDFPAPSGGTKSTSGLLDAFVTKFSADGSALLYTTLIGGSGDDSGQGIVVKGFEAYVVGNTRSSNFPALVLIGPRGGQDMFVAKLDSSGAPVLSMLTRVGGSADDFATAIAVDGSGNAYVGGETFSTDFPTFSPLFQATNPDSDGGFITKLVLGSATPAFSTYIGGSGGDAVYGLALDSTASPNNLYVSGTTGSPDFPTTPGAFQTNNAGLDDAFVAAMKADGSAKVYCTYLGGSGHDGAFGIAVDSAGEAYVTGGTPSANFPIANAAQGTPGGGNDVFITKLNAAGSGLVFSTYLGGTLDESGTGIALDSFGDPYVTGRTSSSNFPVPASGAPFQSNLNLPSDAFVTELSNTGFIVYSSYLGGIGDENIASLVDIGAVAVDSTSNAYLAGNTNSRTGFPPIMQKAYGGGPADAFVAKVGAAPKDFSVSVSPSSVSVTSGQSTSTITVTVSSVNSAFNSGVNVSCSGKPSKAACNFSAASVTPGASNAPGTSALTISTNGSTGNGMLAPPMNHGSQWFYATLLPIGGLALIGAGTRRKKLFGLLMLGLTLTALLVLPACGGGGGGGGGGGNNTPPGTYTITVNGAAGGSTRSAQLTLKVN